MAPPLRAFLEKQSLSPIQAKLWAHFVDTAFMALRRAHSMLTEADNWSAFQSKAGALAKRKMAGSAVPTEHGLTSELGDFLDVLRKSSGPDDSMRVLEMTFQVERPIRSSTRAGNHRRRADIVVGSNLSDTAPELAIEAKLLLDDDDIQGKYLSGDGLGCFLTTDSPYTRAFLGAMLAYVVSQNELLWRDKIQKALEAPPSVAEVCEHLLVEGEQVPTLCSRMPRAESGLCSILILHIMMRFDIA